MNKIEYIYQYYGRNVLTVVYKSGFKRYVYLGDSYYNFTKTQLDFMQKASRHVYRDYANYWFINCPSWFHGCKGG